MKLLNYDKVLCLSPHPDDVEYSMSGTIMKYTDTQFDVLCLTIGGAEDKTSSNSRHQEVKKFWDGVLNVELLYLSLDIANYREDVAIRVIESKLDMSDYDSIFIPCREDNHFFHRNISTLGRSLCRVSKFALIEYFTPSAEISWIPNMIVEIENQYESKKKRMQEFESQIKHTYFSDFCLDAFHSDLHYNKKGFGWIEKFKILNLHL